MQNYLETKRILNKNKKHLDMFKNKILRIILHEGGEDQKK
jgi:hypothetical protein